MISSNDLKRALNMLAQISSDASYDSRQKCLEIGYIIDKELSIVEEIERDNRNNGRGNINTKSILNDNVQLFQENQKLLQENMSLKSMLESRISNIAFKMRSISEGIAQMNQSINSLR